MTRVSYQGTHGAFSHQACQKYFNEKETHFRGCQTFNDVLDLVKSGDCDYAVIPVDNSSAGRIAEVYNILPYSDLFIVGECFLPIHFCLLMPTKAVRGKPDENLSKEELMEWKNREPNEAEVTDAINRITDIYTHHQGVILCEKFMKKTLHKVRIHETWDTAGAARDLAIDFDTHSASLAPKTAVRYDMTVLLDKVEDDKNSTSRFLILASKPLKAQDVTENPVTSLMFQTKNEAGALFAALEVFKRHNINITKLETYMIGANHSSPHFYVDLEINQEDEAGKKALSELVNVTLNVKVLGTYSRAKGLA
ncbi:MAG: prephenate dehydratase [Alphaproteobacteria bacterium]